MSTYNFAGLVTFRLSDDSTYAYFSHLKGRHRLTESRMSDDHSLWFSTSGSLYRNTSPTDFQLVAASISLLEYGEWWDE